MKKKAEYLLDEMAYIDDAFIAEAESYRKKSIKPIIMKTAGIAAAIILCISSIIMTVPFLNGIFSRKESDESSAPATLSTLLDEKRDDALFLGTESISFGENMLVWQYEGESGYYVMSLGKETASLTALAGKGSNLSPEESEKYNVRIWLCRENGEVISPQLIGSTGNIGYKCLFDYDPEIEPSTDFLKELEKTLSRI